MAKKPEKQLLVALDIGTSKVVVLVGEVSEDGALSTIGVGLASSTGMKKGVVVDIESTVEAIRKAVEEAELMADCRIGSATTGIAGTGVRSFNSHGIVAIRDREVTYADVERVLDAARAVAVPADQKILHILPQEFIVDSHEGIREPIGISGVRLEAKVHMVTGAASAAQNITKCVRRCDLMVSDMVLEQLASSYAVLTNDEKELGVCLVDIGGGTTDIAIFTEGAIRHTAVIPIAGDQVTNDLAIALRTPTQAAEEIKRRYASALIDSADSNELIDVPGVHKRAGRQISKKMLAEVVEPRYAELFALIRADLRRSGFEDLVTAGIVLTGGASKVEGVIELAESIFHMPVRLGIPQNVQGLANIVGDPTYATAVGLLQHGYQQQFVKSTEMLVGRNSGIKAIWNRLCNWVAGNF